ncbi:MAG TPA: EscU/YscU/HrcU family type III secretion system export apparatus switch protein [Bryobacteraceae bacterium]|nr:EscU/YscU/HrcU family type III secretion system export apparatus switch protein [Bryobacteraceae bacterium]
MADQRTEKATPERLKKARAEGQFPAAKDFVSALQYIGIVIILTSWGSIWFRGMAEDLKHLLARAFVVELNAVTVAVLAKDALFRAFTPIGIAAAGIVAFTVLLQLATTNMGVSFKRFAPTGAKFNPMKRLMELPKQNVPSAVQALVLMAVMGYVLYLLIIDNLPGLLLLPFSSVPAGVARIAASVDQLLWRAAAVLLALGSIEFVRNRASYAKQLRMTKQEVKDEMKTMEGNPQIKSHIRSLRRQLLRRQMMRAVPTATAVIVNPTHYAVAIRYEMETMASPLVVAKGKNFLALRIRQKAVESGVPIIENPPLARGLYTAAEVGQEIPAEFFRAVAEVLAYIYRLMGRRRAL